MDAARRFVEAHYALDLAGVTSLGESKGAGGRLFRLQDRAGRNWVLRLQRRRRPVPSWYGGGEVAGWLARRAALLAWLVARGYPVPEPLRTRAGTHIARDDRWCGMLLDFIDGERIAPGPAPRAALGRALGRLHRIPETPPALSWWHPRNHAVAYARDRLAAAGDVPSEWRALAAAASGALAAMAAAPPLPGGCIHGDVWAGNAIQGLDAGVRLIDWDAAGAGTPLLDLGALLVDCYRGDPPAVEPAWVAAALDGYRSTRRLSRPEIETLPAAIRFGPAFRAAIRLALAAAGAWTGATRRGLVHEAARLQISDDVARMARSHLAGA